MITHFYVRILYCQDAGERLTAYGERPGDDESGGPMARRRSWSREIDNMLHASYAANE